MTKGRVRTESSPVVVSTVPGASPLRRTPSVLSVAALAALALPAAAAAAASTITGTVVHQRSGDSFVVAAANGALFAVHGRAPGAGRRVTVRAVALRNGTFAARAITVTCRIAKARVQGVVTSSRAGRRDFVLSAHGASLLVRGAAPAPGAHVSTVATIAARGLQAARVRRLASAPRETVVPLTGRVTGRDVARRTLTLTADDAGAATARTALAVRPGLDLAGYRIGMPVTATATLTSGARRRAVLEGISSDTPRGAAARSDDRGDAAADKITVCHAAGGGYVEVTVAVDALNGHAGHAGDIIPAPATGCPAATGTTPSALTLTGDQGATSSSSTSPSSSSTATTGFGAAASVCASAGLPTAAAAKLEYPGGFGPGGVAALGGGLSGTVSVDGDDNDTVAFAVTSASPRVAGAVIHAGAGQEVAVYDYAPATAGDHGLHGPSRTGKPNPYATISFVVLCSDGVVPAPGQPTTPSTPVPATPPAPVTPVLPTAPAAPPAPASPPDGPLITVGKVEQQVDLAPLQTRSVDLACPAGALMTDGRPRVDAVGQGLGTLASVQIVEATSTGPGSFRFTLRNSTLGSAQAKVFGVCVITAAGVPALGVGQPVGAPAQLLGPGDHTVTLTCAVGTVPVAPGFAVTGGAATVSRSARVDDGWELGFRVPVAATVSASARCLDPAVGTAHRLQTRGIGHDVPVAPGSPIAESVICGDQEKGIVAGFSVPAGVLWLGDDPEPKTRVFRLQNTGSGVMTASVSLVCLAERAVPAS